MVANEKAQGVCLNHGGGVYSFSSPGLDERVREVAAEVLDGQRDAVQDELCKAFDLCDREIEKWAKRARDADDIAERYIKHRETILDEMSERRRARK